MRAVAFGANADADEDAASDLHPYAVAADGDADENGTLHLQMIEESRQIVDVIVLVAMTLGAMLPPYWTSLVAERWGLHTALTVNCFMLVPLIFLGLYLLRTESRQPKPQAATLPT